MTKDFFISDTCILYMYTDKIRTFLNDFDKKKLSKDYIKKWLKII